MNAERIDGCGFSRKVWWLEPVGGRAERIGLFLDGVSYVARMRALEVIREMQRSGDVPPMACGFVSHGDAAAGHRDFTCSDEYADYLTEEVMARGADRFRCGDGARHLIAGTSLAGLQSAFVALSRPDLFSHCLAQSGAFWWSDELLTGHAQRMDPVDVRFWLSVGDRETADGISHPPSGIYQKVSQVAACERFARSLAGNGCEVRHRMVPGGHEVGRWQSELAPALRWLFGAGESGEAGISVADERRRS